MRSSVSRTSGPAMVMTPITPPCAPRTGAAMAVIAGANTSLIIEKPRLRVARRNTSSAFTVVGAFGPKSSGWPKPCFATSCSACSSVMVESHAWPAELHERFTDRPMSGS
ncbi:hypothetical protein D9M69_618640 [compost metagenome]